jgi:hypothetical protein
LLGKGDGTFTVAPASPSIGGESGDFVVGDFNGDGNLDIAALNSSVSNGTLVILLGNGDGTFRIGPTGPPLGSEPTGIALGDFNGNGIEDLAISNAASSNVMLLLGNGDGSFTVASTTTIPGSNPSNLVAADFNGNGTLDLAVANDLGTEILLGQGNGTFTTGPPISAPPGSINVIRAVGDFNGDGIPDLLMVQGTESGIAKSIVIYLGTGGGAFSQSTSYSLQGTDPFVDYVVAGDFNGDGIPDFAAEVGENAASPTNTVTQWITASSELATATLNTTLPIGSGTHQLVASYSGDANYGSSVSTAVSTLAVFATSLSLSIPPGDPIPGQPLTLTATLSPYMESGYTSTNGATITFYNGSTVLGTGTLANGVATFTTPLINDQTTYTFNATYAGNVDFAAATSAPLTVIAPPIPTILTLALSPSNPSIG